jgi:hypothetical protein
LQLRDAAPMDGRWHSRHNLLCLDRELLRDLYTRRDGGQSELSPVVRKGEKQGTRAFTLEDACRLAEVGVGQEVKPLYRACGT